MGAHRLLARLLASWALLASAAVASAQTFPKLTGRVVDAANIIPPADEATISAKLEALETASTRQLVVATVPDLQGRDIADYGYRLLRAWGVGQKGADNGAILIVAPNERSVRVEVGYGLEPILTDAVSSLIIQNQITPAFKRGDYSGGVSAGVDALAQQLQAPPEVAERAAVEAAGTRRQQRAGESRGGGGSIIPLLFWGAIFLFVILPMLRRGGGRGKRYRSGGSWGSRRDGMDPATSIILWELANAATRGGRGSDGGGWGGFGGGFEGGGGFSAGGGSGGGGGASGSW